MKTFTYPFPAGREGVFIRQIIDAIQAEKVFLFPTETVYGLGGSALSLRVANRITRLKQRPGEKAFPILVSSYRMLESLTENIPDAAKKLINHYWPGPLTILFNARRGLPAGTISREGKIAVRISSHPFLQQLGAAGLSLPLIATSANISSRPAVKSWSELDPKLKQEVDFAIDGGSCPPGKASTIVDATASPLKIIRPGNIIPPKDLVP